MPLTAKGEKIKSNMEATYGPEKAEEVFYASKNKGTITGVDAMSGSTGTPPAVSSAPAPAMPSVTGTAPSGMTTGINTTAPVTTPTPDAFSVRGLARAAGARDNWPTPGVEAPLAEASPPPKPTSPTVPPIAAGSDAKLRLGVKGLARIAGAR